MNLKDIQNLIKFVAKSGATEVKLEMQDIKITVKTTSEKTETIVQQAPQVVLPQQSVPPVPFDTASNSNAAVVELQKEKSEATAKYQKITSPIIGTFYRKSAPEKPALVEVGDTISQGDVVCIVEAMKLFNEIPSEISGKIVEVLVEDQTPVEFGTPLFLVDPS